MRKPLFKQTTSALPLYSWTDAQGAKHYTDTQPPLVIRIRDQTIAIYGWIKGKLFKKKAKKKKKQ